MAALAKDDAYGAVTSRIETAIRMIILICSHFPPTPTIYDQSCNGS